MSKLKYTTGPWVFDKDNPVLIWAGLFSLAQRNPTSGAGSSGSANCL